MIFVTVGTHEQPFNRLVQYMDKLKENSIIEEEVVIQTGFSTYEPKYCTWSNLFSYQEMIQNVAEARIIITHGGPSSFVMPLQVGKIPVVVPRQKQFDEHINNHQVDFSKAVAERQGNIIVIENINDLEETILNFERIIVDMSPKMKSNNAVFNEKFGELVLGELLESGKSR